MDSPESAKAKVPLQEYRLSLADREYTILHTGLLMTVAEENKAVTGLLELLPYGTALWPASIALAHELAARGDALAGLNILELGAGVGLPGIVAASYGANVTQTDQYEMVVSLGQLNAQRNQVNSRIDYRPVDWRDWHDPALYDLIIGADILYYDFLHSDLWRIFQANLAPAGHLLLVDSMRPPSAGMIQIFDQHGWTYDTQFMEMGEGEERREFALFDVVRTRRNSY